MGTLSEFPIAETDDVPTQRCLAVSLCSTLQRPHTAVNVRGHPALAEWCGVCPLLVL